MKRIEDSIGSQSERQPRQTKAQQSTEANRPPTLLGRLGNSARKLQRKAVGANKDESVPAPKDESPFRRFLTRKKIASKPPPPSDIPRPEKRASLERRPSMGGSFCAPRRDSLERRPSMDEFTLKVTTRHLESYSNPNSTEFDNDLMMRSEANIPTHMSEELPPPPPLRPYVTEPFVVPDEIESKKPQNYDNFVLHKREARAIKPPQPIVRHPLVMAMLQALSKEHLLDLTLIGRDGVRVKSSRYIMACRIPYMEDRLFQNDNFNGEVHVGEYSEVVLKALVEFCFAGELILSPLQTEETDGSARGLVQLGELAASLEFKTLVEESYQLARRLMNRHLSLSPAVYDEASKPEVRDFKAYAIQTIADCPKEALLDKELAGAAGVEYLSSAKLESLLNDPILEVEPMTVFRMLFRWVEQMGRSEEALEFARKRALKINLKYIDRIDLLTTVKQSDFVDRQLIDEAIAEQERDGAAALVTERTHLERVLVKGAGLASINGLYFREHDRDGQAMYEMGHGNDIISLHRWGTTWGIAPAHDLSNLYYVCEVPYDSDEVPFLGWKVGPNGQFPAPTCRWVAPEDDPNRQRSIKEALPACFQNEEELYGN